MKPDHSTTATTCGRFRNRVRQRWLLVPFPVDLRYSATAHNAICHSERHNATCHSERHNAICHSERHNAICHSERHNATCHSERHNAPGLGRWRLSLRTTQRHLSLRTTQPHLSLRTTQPHLSLRTTQPHLSLRTTQRHLSLRTTQPICHSERHNAHLSLRTTQRPLSFRAKRNGVEKSPRHHLRGNLRHWQNELETALGACLINRLRRLKRGSKGSPRTSLSSGNVRTELVEGLTIGGSRTCETGS